MLFPVKWLFPDTHLNLVTIQVFFKLYFFSKLTVNDNRLSNFR